MMWWQRTPWRSTKAPTEPKGTLISTVLLVGEPAEDEELQALSGGMLPLALEVTLRDRGPLPLDRLALVGVEGSSVSQSTEVIRHPHSMSLGLFPRAQALESKEISLPKADQIRVRIRVPPRQPQPERRPFGTRDSASPSSTSARDR
jgi:hypothetical protein